jgi:hypothetical protein
MKRRTVLAATAAFLLSLSTAVGAQTMKSVAGTYSVVKVSAYGEGARGVMNLTPDGHYSIMLARATLPKIAGNARTKGTAEENKAIVDGSIFHFGTYTIDDGGKSITFNIKASSFPNWDGTSQKRAIKVSGDEFTYTVTAPSAGGPPNDVVWKRMK